MWWLWYSHILKRNIQLTITLHNMVIKKVLIFCTVITKSKDPDTFCFGQKSLPGVRIIFSRLSGEQGRNLSSYRNAEWITQQRGSQREEFYVKAQKCKKSYYRSGGHSHNSVEKKEGNCFIKRRSDNFKNIFLLLQTLPSSLRLLRLCQSQWRVYFSSFWQQIAVCNQFYS